MIKPFPAGEVAANTVILQNLAQPVVEQRLSMGGATVFHPDEIKLHTTDFSEELAYSGATYSPEMRGILAAKMLVRSLRPEERAFILFGMKPSPSDRQARALALGSLRTALAPQAKGLTETLDYAIEGGLIGDVHQAVKGRVPRKSCDLLFTHGDEIIRTQGIQERYDESARTVATRNGFLQFLGVKVKTTQIPKPQIERPTQAMWSQLNRRGRPYDLRRVGADPTSLKAEQLAFEHLLLISWRGDEIASGGSSTRP